MVDLDIFRLKKNYSLINIRNILIRLINNLESHELSDFVDTLFPFVNNDLYHSISKNSGILYSGDYYLFIIIYTLVEQVEKENAESITSRLIEYL